MSGDVSEAARQASQSPGFLAHICKPVLFEEVRAAIERAMEARYVDVAGAEVHRNGSPFDEAPSDRGRR